MPEIIPIRDLKNTNAISQRCHETQEPIFVTKSGYRDMVIMSIREHGSGTFWLGRLGGWQVPLYEPKSHISYAVLKRRFYHYVSILPGSCNHIDCG